MAEIDEIQQAIAALDAQRPLLGDAVVETALAPLRQKLAVLKQALQPAEQRRLVTVLFADLVGFTAMSEGLDPEDTREILNDYFARWSTAIQRHNGQVEKFIGDAVMAVFGMLTAREDDPENAIRAALEMRQELAALNQALPAQYGVELAIRVGVHTGPVVVSTLGEREGQEFVVVGDAVNLTSRLQAAAPPGGILISHDAYRHVREVFEVEPLEPLRVKGKSEPVQAYLVTGEEPRGFRLTRRGLRGRESPLVGREQEMEQLQAAYRAAVGQKRTQLVTILGEPGVGKSRLLDEFSGWLEVGVDEIPLLFRARATRSMEQIPYALLKQLLSNQFDIRNSDPADLVQGKLEEGLMPFLAGDAQSKSHFIAALAGFDLGDSPHLLGVRNDSRQLHDRALLYLLQFCDVLLSRMPTVVILDDIHWADDPSLETFLRIAREYPDRQFMIICLAQPRLLDKHADWALLGNATGAQVSQISLLPLSQDHSRQMLEEILAGASTLPQALGDKIVAGAEGNPFYLEELVQMLIEEGVLAPDGQSGGWRFVHSALGDLRIPPTLTAVLQARLDGLPAGEKSTLQRASVAGRLFWDALVQEMAHAEQPPEEELEALSGRDLVLPQATSGFEHTREYQFRHAVLRDVTYETLLRRERRQYHARVAAWLEEMTRLSGRQAEFQALIAEHYDQAGEQLLAADAYVQAGEHARDIGASQEARHFFERAGELIPLADHERRWRLLLGWCEVLSILGDQQPRRAGLEEMINLAEQMDQNRQAEAYYRYGWLLDGSGESQAAAHAYQQARDAARSAGNILLEAMVLALLSMLHSRQGQLDLALMEAGQARDCLAQSAETDQIRTTMIRLNLSVTYMAAGDFEQSYWINQEQAGLAHRLGNLRAEGVALNNMGYCQVVLGRFVDGRWNFAASMEVFRSIADRIDAALAGLNLGLALWRIKEIESSIQALEPARLELDALGHIFGSASGWLYQGLAEESAGKPEAARHAFEEAKGKFESLDMPGSAADARAGLARAALQMGDLPAARQLADAVRAHLSEHGSAGMEFTILNYLTCAQVYAACGDFEAEAGMIQAGHAELVKKAALIRDPEWRATYLECIPEHRSLIERWGAFNKSKER